MEQIELRRRAAEGLLALDEPFRTTLPLRFMLGDPLRDVTKKTGVAASTAKDRCDRGLLQLRRSLESEVGESGEPSRDWLQALVGAAEVLTLAPNELVPVEIVVRPLPSVSGVVRRPDGSAVNAAAVRLVRPAEARDRAQTRVLVPGSSTSDPGAVRWQVATTSTDATGAFELEAPESGRYLVIVGDPLTTGVESLPFEVSSNNAPDRLSLTIAEGGIIQGTVHVPGVESLVGWQVKLARSSQVLGIRRGANPAACQVDADGRFTLGPLQAGETKVYLVEPERLNDSAIYRTSQGHTEALGVVNVQNGITSTVEFTAPGPPLATVRSHLTVQQDPHLWHRVTLVPVAAPDWAQNHARSGDAGSIGPIYARPGEYYVRVQSPSWAWQRPATITVTEGQTIDLELRIELERRVVRLRNLDGSPSDGHIMVRRLPVDGESRGTTVTTVLPDENGDFEIGLSAGTYEFSDPIQETAVRERWPIVEGQITLVLRPAGG